MINSRIVLLAVMLALAVSQPGVPPEEPGEKFRKDLGRVVLIAGICISAVSLAHPDNRFAFFIGAAVALLGLYLERTGWLPFQ